MLIVTLKDDEESNDGKNNNNHETSFTSSQSEDEDVTPAVDLSSLVKVEIVEEHSPVGETATQRSSETRSRSPSPQPSTPGYPSSIPFPPPPPLARQGEHFPHHFTKDPPNMFHFGDVKINHHPDTQPVPMVIPIVYLYPIEASDEGKI